MTGLSQQLKVVEKPGFWNNGTAHSTTRSTTHRVVQLRHSHMTGCMTSSSDVMQNEACREVPGPSKGMGQGHQVQKIKIFKGSYVVYQMKDLDE